MSFTIVVNVPEVTVFTEELGAEIAAIIGPAMYKGARARAPVRTGKLLDDIEWRYVPGPGGGQVELSTVWYDLFLELPAKQIKTPIRTLIGALDDIPRLL